MSRILAIDYGSKRTGIAVTDPMQIIASGLSTVATGKLDAFLDDYMKSEDVSTIVVGEPRQMDYSMSELGERISAFAKALQTKYPSKQIVMVDERFTSKMAQAAILQSGAKKKRRRDKALVDEVAATIILQTYLDRIKTNL